MMSPTMTTTMVTVEFHDDTDGSVTTVQVPEGTKIIQAARQANVYIPTLCHHPRLTPVGKCGLCVVSVEGGPTPTQLACTTTVCRRDGGSAPNNNDDEDDDHHHSMRVHVHGPVLNGLADAALRRNLDRSSWTNPTPQRFAAHNNDLAPCGTLELEDLAAWVRHEMVDVSSNAISYDPSLCIGCSRCVRACDQLQGMKVLEAPLPLSSGSTATVGIATAPPCMTTRAGRVLKETDCISCGQCTVFCPTGAIKEVDHTPQVMRALSDPDRVVVLQTAPSVRVTISEMFGEDPGAWSEQKLVGAAKACGFHFVFDTNMTADLTIMEEANELLHRIDIAQNGTEHERKKSPLPMFTSCCPGWINLVEQSYPELIPHLSTCRSPMGMLSSVIRHHWWPKQLRMNEETHEAHDSFVSWPRTKKGHSFRKRSSRKLVLQQENEELKSRVANLEAKLAMANDTETSLDEIDQSKLYVVAVMPCTAKKDEMARDQLRMLDGKPETDAVLTVREFGRLMELRGVAKREDPYSSKNIPELMYDNPFGDSTGAAIIFGVTGGVMEAALRTAADVLSGKDIQRVKYEGVRGMAGIKEATVQLGRKNEIDLSVAVCHQMRNVREFLAQIEAGEKTYHFVEVMTCPGGCIGGGGLPQSRDPNILVKRVSKIYSLDERNVIRKSHQNKAVSSLYFDLLGKPLSHLSHQLLHTSYYPRPRKPPIALKAPTQAVATVMDSDSSNSVCIVFGTQSGTAAQAAKEIKVELLHFIGRSKAQPEPEVRIVAGNAMSPERLLSMLNGALATIFVTSTFGEGEFPETMLKLYEYLESCGDQDFSGRFAVFGLGSSMYAAGDQFNQAARMLDKRLGEIGGSRIIEVGLGDDQAAELYRGELDKFMEKLEPKLFGQSAGASFIDPPEPLYRISLAAGSHGRHFRPVPPNYHFVTLQLAKSMVSEGYHRPASMFSFSLANTGLKYDVGDHLAVLPRNPEIAVNKILALYAPAIEKTQLLSVEAVDHFSTSPFPSTLTAGEMLEQYLDLCARPSRGFFKQLYLFATTAESRAKLRVLFDRENPNVSQDAFELYTGTHTYVDVLCDFAKDSLPPFEYLLSMIPTICPRLYSIASSPLGAAEDQLDLLVVSNKWKDAAKQERVGLATQYLFGAEVGERVAVQIKTGILQPPANPETPVLMFGLGTGVAPFRGFLQHRQALKRNGAKLGPATLYVGFRHEMNDYYLQHNYQTWIEEGVLTAVRPVFSHDSLKEWGGKLYFISDLIAEHPEDMFNALIHHDEAEGKHKSDVHVYCKFFQGPWFACLFVSTTFPFIKALPLFPPKIVDLPWAFQRQSRQQWKVLLHPLAW